MRIFIYKSSSLDLRNDVQFCVKMEVNASAKSIDSDPHAQSAPADLRRNVFYSSQLSAYQKPCYLKIHWSPPGWLSGDRVGLVTWWL